MSRDNERSQSKKSIDSSILAAIITVVGGICIALLPTALNMLTPRLTPIPPTDVVSISTSTAAPTPVPTHTVPVGESTSTPAPDTPTPEPTFTPAPPRIGEDWVNGCISTLWEPYPSIAQPTEIDGCLSEPINNVFYADAGSLRFLVDNRFANTEVYGMFAPLPANGTASVDVLLRRLQDGEIWMGVFAEPDIASQGMIIVIPPGDVKKRVLVQKTMPGQIEVQQTASFTPGSPGYNVVFEFGNGSVRTIIMRDTVFDALPVAATQQWLFVGYQVKKGGNRIDAEFLNLVIQ